jgi:hypothetical protein
MNIPEFQDGVQPEEGAVEDATPSSTAGLRLKSLILLGIFVLPTVLTILEILTGRVSGWWVEKAAPLLPYIELVHF